MFHVKQCRPEFSREFRFGTFANAMPSRRPNFSHKGTKAQRHKGAVTGKRAQLIRLERGLSRFAGFFVPLCLCAKPFFFSNWCLARIIGTTYPATRRGALKWCLAPFFGSGGVPVTA
jgi:hypothetical protein